MEDYGISKNFRFSIKVSKTTTGKYSYIVKANGDTINEISKNLEEVIKVAKARVAVALAEDQEWIEANT